MGARPARSKCVSVDRTVDARLMVAFGGIGGIGVVDMDGGWATRGPFVGGQAGMGPWGCAPVCEGAALARTSPPVTEPFTVWTPGPDSRGPADDCPCNAPPSHDRRAPSESCLVRA
jgi:hypothetical protein